MMLISINLSQYKVFCSDWPTEVAINKQIDDVLLASLNLFSKKFECQGKCTHTNGTYTYIASFDPNISQLVIDSKKMSGFLATDFRMTSNLKETIFDFFESKLVSNKILKTHQLFILYLIYCSMLKKNNNKILTKKQMVKKVRQYVNFLSFNENILKFSAICDTENEAIIEYTIINKVIKITKISCKTEQLGEIILFIE